MLKKLLFPLLSIFLGFRSYELLRVLWFSHQLTALEELVFGVLLNIFLTGMVAIPGFAFATHKLVGSSYYEIKHPVLLRKAYRMLRLDLFRRALMLVFWGRKSQRKKFFDGTASGIENFIFQTKQAEFGHIVSFVLLALTAVLSVVQGYYVLALVSTCINTIGNLYPALLQRSHRHRIDRVLKLEEQRSKRF